MDTSRDPRHDLGTFVGPMALGPDEGYMAVNLSRNGMAILRMVAEGESDERALDRGYAWLGVPLPEVGIQLNALVEVVHRKRIGRLEAVGVRFRYLAPEEQAALDAYLEHRSWELPE